MNFSSHLKRAAQALAVIANSPDGDLIPLLQAWYKEHVEVLYRGYEARHQGLWSLGIDALLGSEASEVPATSQALALFRRWASTFRWRDRHDFIAQVDRELMRLAVYCDEACPCADTGDCAGREIWFDEDSRRLVALCTSVTGGAFDLNDKPLVVDRLRPARRAELEAAGLIRQGD